MSLLSALHEHIVPYLHDLVDDGLWESLSLALVGAFGPRNAAHILDERERTAVEESLELLQLGLCVMVG